MYKIKNYYKVNAEHYMASSNSDTCVKFNNDCCSISVIKAVWGKEDKWLGLSKPESKRLADTAKVKKQ